MLKRRKLPATSAELRLGMGINYNKEFRAVISYSNR